MKTAGGFRRTRYRGVERTGLAGYFVATAYNLVRMANLLSFREPPGRSVRVTRQRWMASLSAKAVHRIQPNKCREPSLTGGP